MTFYFLYKAPVQKITNFVTKFDDTEKYVNEMSSEVERIVKDTIELFSSDITSYLEARLKTLELAELRTTNTWELLSDTMDIPQETKMVMREICNSVKKMPKKVVDTAISSFQKDTAPEVCDQGEKLINDLRDEISKKFSISTTRTCSLNNNLEKKIVKKTATSSETDKEAYDLGNIDLEKMDKDKKLSLIFSQHVKPPANFKPQPFMQKTGTKDGNQSFKMRNLNLNILDSYNWLAFSMKDEGLWCVPCALFHNGERSKDFYGNLSLGKFIKYPLKDYTRLTSDITSHQKTKAHNVAVNGIQNLKNEVVNPQITLRGNTMNINSHQIENNRAVLIQIISAIKMCAIQNIPLRGHRDAGLIKDSGRDMGNFKEILRLMSTKSKNLQVHITSGSSNAQYTSPEIQNEIIDIIANLTKAKILGRIRNATCFAISFDETTDIEHKEQMVFTIRYLNSFDQIEKMFLGFYDYFDLAKKLSPNQQVEAKLDGKTIAKIVGHILYTLDLNHTNKCVSISTDGAASLSGSYLGAVTILQEAIIPKAVWAYCMSHMLDLCVGGTFTTKGVASAAVILNKIHLYSTSVTLIIFENQTLLIK